MTTLTDRSYSWTKTATDRNKDSRSKIDSIDENSVTTNNINSSELSLPELFSKVEKSCVQVAKETDTDVSSGSRLGSGFVYDRDRHIVTNYHVIAGGATEGNVQVTFQDGNTYNAKLIGVILSLI